MSAVHGKNTTPEIKVRKVLHALGFRFRLHKKDLPGKPDVVLAKYRTCIFVHGCFWHQHPGCKRASRPTSNVEFWSRKLQGNIERDKNNLSKLRHLGWRAIVIWECETKNMDELKHNLCEVFRLGNLRQSQQSSQNTNPLERKI
ncbi:MAG: DNA mismatch endonuclease Vsr [Sulfuricella sp.]|nr:DNA mismatch endonuclease Vsr [Sulfuricella sp.]